MPRQREPRIKDERHLNFVRSLPCCVCGGIDVDAAHIRTGEISLGKRPTGGAEKPSDKWTVPLCRGHHDEQHSMNEMVFWKKYGIDPFMLAMTLRAPK
jgi:hypothetical protein